MEQRQQEKKRDRIVRTLNLLYILFLLMSVIVVGRIFWIQHFYKPSPELEIYVHPPEVKKTVLPKRGAILDRKGRMLAVYSPMYDPRLDCTVQPDSVWTESLGQVAEGLSDIYGGTTAEQFTQKLREGRRNRNRNLRLGHPVSFEELQRIKSLPMLSRKRNIGGLKDDNKSDSLMQPYAPLGRVIIRALEEKHGNILRGKTGSRIMTTSENRKQIPAYDSTEVKVENGNDIRTTLDVDIQDIADRALREVILGDTRVEGGCALVMEVRTGALRAFANLRRDTTQRVVRETYNYATMESGEPGSVFKTVGLLSLLESGEVTLETRLKTNHGILKNFPFDDHIPPYEQENHTDEISLIEGYKRSSNYVFRKLVIDHYQNNPQRYIDHIYQYKLGEQFDFDGGKPAMPTVIKPQSGDWSGTTLGSIAIGYSVRVTPLHILTFYNAIANRGRMMKPYLIEDIESEGRLVEKRGEGILNESICSPATADTIRRAMLEVTHGSHGTAAGNLRRARAAVAGKTGTARRPLSREELKGENAKPPYTDSQGRNKFRSTFVGFFPAGAGETPKYTVLVCLFTGLSRQTLGGGGYPARATRLIVDELYALDAGEREVSASAKMPESAAPRLEADKGCVPDLAGLGLSDALYAIEKAGYVCRYEGVGHVVKQSPAAGACPPEGSTVQITLGENKKK